MVDALVPPARDDAALEHVAAAKSVHLVHGEYARIDDGSGAVFGLDGEWWAWVDDSIVGPFTTPLEALHALPEAPTCIRPMCPTCGQVVRS